MPAFDRKQEIRVPGMAEPVSHYTDVVRAGRLVFVSGCVAVDVQCGEPGWQSHFDTDPDQARATRRAFLAGCANRDVWVLGTHFHAPTAGHVVREGSAWRFRV